MGWLSRARMVSLVVVVVALGACATAPRPGDERISRALVKVLSAEADHMRADSRAHELRVAARRSYQDGTRTLRDRRYAQASLLFDRAEAEADLALALAREEAWTQQERDAEATLEWMQATAGRQSLELPASPQQEGAR